MGRFKSVVVISAQAIANITIFLGAITFLHQRPSALINLNLPAPSPDCVTERYTNCTIANYTCPTPASAITQYGDHGISYLLLVSSFGYWVLLLVLVQWIHDLMALFGRGSTIWTNMNLSYEHTDTISPSVCYTLHWFSSPCIIIHHNVSSDVTLLLLHTSCYVLASSSGKHSRVDTFEHAWNNFIVWNSCTILFPGRIYNGTPKSRTSAPATASIPLLCGSLCRWDGFHWSS